MRQARRRARHAHDAALSRRDVDLDRLARGGSLFIGPGQLELLAVGAGVIENPDATGRVGLGRSGLGRVGQPLEARVRTRVGDGLQVELDVRRPFKIAQRVEPAPLLEGR